MTLETIFTLAACVSSASFTITFTGIFKEIREKISKEHHKLEELIHCPWCLSHWITFLFLIITGQEIEFTGIWLLDFMMTTFTITLLSGLGHYVLLRAYEPVGKAMAARQIEKLRNNKAQSDGNENN